MIIRRGFADLAHGQMHYRSAGSGPPLVLLHMSPGSSRQQLGLIAGLADRFTVHAPDTPGNGDSPALPVAEPTIVDLAHAMLGFIDALGLDRIALYGSHTGAAITAELAVLAPGRIDRLILDGVQRLTDAARAEMLARYADPFTPDLDGAWLARAFQFCRDQSLFYPWYERSRAARRSGGLPSAEALGALVTEVLKAGETYHRNYHAAFRWEAAARLPLVAIPALLIAAADDPLCDDTRALTPLVSGATFTELPRYDDPDHAWARIAAIQAFADATYRQAEKPGASEDCPPAPGL
ncbi:alpha/beta fold hydrolase [Glacieibacterium frigidum]|uniref:Alpha/beta hydrolase n=1 Tax=Glacieibacterium frigidum TaxID=2593303 RepID=A0A552U891_9SPHN|nr:alpha/beta fold hydrolase [Glacieibacterium frigidum]TRW14437.1 alpha/beta hydrolase [Glacieibacterium frigidum]